MVNHIMTTDNFYLVITVHITSKLTKKKKIEGLFPQKIKRQFVQCAHTHKLLSTQWCKESHILLKDAQMSTSYEETTVINSKELLIFLHSPHTDQHSTWMHCQHEMRQCYLASSLKTNIWQSHLTTWTYSCSYSQSLPTNCPTFQTSDSATAVVFANLTSCQQPPHTQYNDCLSACFPKCHLSQSLFHITSRRSSACTSP